MIEFENTENKVETPQNFDNSKNTLLDEVEFKDEKNIAFSCRNVDLFYDNGEKHSLKNINNQQCHYCFLEYKLLPLLMTKLKHNTESLNLLPMTRLIYKLHHTLPYRGDRPGLPRH